MILNTIVSSVLWQDNLTEIRSVFTHLPSGLYILRHSYLKKIREPECANGVIPNCPIGSCYSKTNF